MLGIARADFEQQAVIAGDVMNLEDLGNGRERLRDARFAGPVGRAQGHKSQQPLIERFRIEMCRIVADHAASFELAEPLENSRWRKAHNPCDLSLRNPGVVLEEVEYLQVDGVEHARPALECEAQNSLTYSDRIVH